MPIKTEKLGVGNEALGLVEYSKEQAEKQQKAKLGQELGTLFLNAMKDTAENQIVYDSNQAVTKDQIMKVGFLDYSREALRANRPKKIQITFSKLIEDPENSKEKKEFDTNVLMIYLNEQGIIDKREPFMLKDLTRQYHNEKNENFKNGEVISEEWKEPSIQDIKALLYPYGKDILTEKGKQKKLGELRT